MAAPTVATSEGSATFVEGANAPPTPVLVDPSIVVSDPDSATLASVTVRITGGFRSGEDYLTIRSGHGVTGISAVYYVQDGTLVISSVSGSTTVAQWQAVLRSVEYYNDSDAPSTATRTISFSVNDGSFSSNIASRTVAVFASNDVPFLDMNASAPGTAANATYEVGAAPTLVAPVATVYEVDSPDLSGGSLTVSYSAGASVHHDLTIRHSGTGPGQIGVSGNTVSYQGTVIGTFSGGDGAQPLVVQLNSAATQPAAQALVRSIAYSTTQPTAESPVLRFELTDGDGGAPIPANVYITYTGDYSPPKSEFASPTQWAPVAPPFGQSWYVGDFNGDGKDDAFRYLPVTSGADMFLSLGNRFTGAGGWTPAGTGTDGRWYVGDFNGDGKDDIFRWVQDVSGADMFLSNGTSFVPGGSWLGVGPNPKSGWFVGDFNGDGRDDVFRYVPGLSGADMFLSTGASFSGAGSWTGAGFGVDGTWHVGDFNGDGRDDIFRYLPGTSGADMFLSNGSGFTHVGSWTPAGAGSDGKWYIGDFNGDGLDDIFRYLEGTSGADVFVSTGSAFAHAGSWTGAGYGTGGWTIGDFTGDGTADLLRVLGSSTEVLI